MNAPRTWLSWAAPCLGALAVACGAAAPSESTIFHDAALRPGISEAADPDEAALLARLADAPPGSVSVGASTFELGAIYPSASGRSCRAVSRATGDRLACAFDEGWRYVPPIERQHLAQHDARGPATHPAPSAPASGSSGAEPDVE